MPTVKENQTTLQAAVAGIAPDYARGLTFNTVAVSRASPGPGLLGPMPIARRHLSRSSPVGTVARESGHAECFPTTIPEPLVSKSQVPLHGH